MTDRQRCGNMCDVAYTLPAVTARRKKTLGILAFLSLANIESGQWLPTPAGRISIHNLTAQFDILRASTRPIRSNSGFPGFPWESGRQLHILS